MKETQYVAIFLFPVAIAVVFSRKSYISEIFKFEMLKILNSLSLAVFLNHIAAIRIVRKVMPDVGFFRGSVLSCLLMIPVIIVYYFVMQLLKLMKNRISG